MAIDLDRELVEILGQGGEVTREDLDEVLGPRTDALREHIEATFGEAGWYESSAAPYDPPAVPFDAPPPANPPVVEAIRRVWVARYNPGADAWDDPLDPEYVNDIDNDTHFPWVKPERAPIDGWWLDTGNTPQNRFAMDEVAVGDLVVLQRTDPGPGKRKAGEQYNTHMLVGLAAVLLVDTWTDADTGGREHRACMVPLAKFDDPVPVRTAKNHDRLKGESFSHPRQLPGRKGPLGFTLSAVDWDDVGDLLAVCGIDPSILVEPELAVAAARLRAGKTGNEDFLRLRYDNVFRDELRRQHERQGIRHAREWADRNDYIERQDCQAQDGVGFDLLFADMAGKELQLEVKGYRSKNLAAVHLQRSQAARAKDAAAGIPPAWCLFALLGAGGKGPIERIAHAVEVVALLAAGKLKVKRR